MFKKFLCKAVVLSSFMFILSVATNASATPITTTAEVVGNITVTQNTALNFGQFTVGTGGGSVVFPAGGVVTVTGDVIHLGSEVGGVADLNTTGVTPADQTMTQITGKGMPTERAAWLSSATRRDLVSGCDSGQRHRTKQSSGL